ncbi:hypothetical protein nbrc107696_10460 [Gordonia spumicola]|uniref:(2E)-enoyl-[ACP] glycyltransferase n=1 Tax=Gordonia spumicola TaxID=589161 RepID=A0A7I9V697_9ACTN|nr:FcoT family thioesterase [Gordonia spumicola]GEE00600.1 hypothetical protein nbrc107696_10460 [Gordonia spumicola]
MSGAMPADADLLDRAMSPYVGKGAVLLHSIQVALTDDTLTADGEFRIGESCYIDDTGHFNAVEFVISYNQLMYAALAHVVRDDLHPAFADWSLDDYWSRQLPNVFITRLDSRYRRPLNPRAYRGRFTVADFTYRNRSQPVLGFTSHIEFVDELGGHAYGDVDIALTDPIGFHSMQED